LTIVFVGIMGEIVEAVLGHAGGTSMEHFQVLRSMRMLRLLRAARVIISFKELYSLICGLSSCLRTLFWAAGLVFLLLTMWSILSVEYLHPLIRKLAEEGYYHDCSYCADAFKDIMNANLTLFQIVSGDGWGELSRPLIIHHPWTAAVIVGIIFTMVFGMLNLITAVIVDTAAQARQLDVLHMGKQKEHERNEAWASFADLCLRLDENHDGEISLEELKTGITEIPELGAHLSVLGVEDDDLEMVFELLDANKDGRITHKEFIKQLYKIQTYELRSAHCFMRHYVEDIRKHVKLLVSRSSDMPSNPSCASVASFNEANQPEPEQFPTRSPPLEPQMPSADAPWDDEQSPEVVSVDDSQNAAPVDDFVSQHSESLTEKFREKAEISSAMQFPHDCQHFDLSSPVCSGGVDKNSFGDQKDWVVDSSGASQDNELNAPSLNSSHVQCHKISSNSMEDFEKHQVSLHLLSQNRQNNAAEECSTSSGQTQSDTVADPQNDHDVELPGVFIQNHFDVECGAQIECKSPSSGLAFGTIMSK